MSALQAQFPSKLRCLFRPSRYKVLYGGRGAAKSWGVARALLLLGARRPIRVLCCREYQNSIRDSVHQLLEDQIHRLGLSHFYDIQNTVIRGLNGTEFGFEGLRRNVTKLKSWEGADIAWVEEGQAVTKKSWSTLIPTIRKEDSEIWVTFNPDLEDDETYQRFVMHPPHDATVLPISFRDNPWFPEVLEQERLTLLARDKDEYEHVWEGRPLRWLEGAIYANELRLAYAEDRITSVPHDPTHEVFTAWDEGHTDDTAIWWYQVIGNELRVLEGFSESGQSISSLASQVLGRQVKVNIIDNQIQTEIGEVIPELEHRTHYNYARHWLSHYAQAHTLASNRSIQEQLQKVLGYAKVRIVPRLSREDGIKSARLMFPNAWFDAEKCEEGLSALRKYRREPRRDDDISLKPNPEHDWASHYADAFRYLSLVWRKPVLPEPEDEAGRDEYGFDEDDDADNWKVA